jgi:hypothetical protein
MAVGWQRHAFARRLLLCYIVSVLYPVSYQTLVALLHCLCFIPSFLPDTCCSVTLSLFYTQFPTRHLLLCYIVSVLYPVSYQTLVALLHCLGFTPSFLPHLLLCYCLHFTLSFLLAAVADVSFSMLQALNCVSGKVLTGAVII